MLLLFGAIKFYWNFQKVDLVLIKYKCIFKISRRHQDIVLVRCFSDYWLWTGVLHPKIMKWLFFINLQLIEGLLTFRIVTSEDYNYFATASDDSTVKIWDTQRLDGKALTTRAKFTYTKQGDSMSFLFFFYVFWYRQTSCHQLFTLLRCMVNLSLPLMLETTFNGKYQKIQVFGK